MRSIVFVLQRAEDIGGMLTISTEPAALFPDKLNGLLVTGPITSCFHNFAAPIACRHPHLVATCVVRDVTPWSRLPIRWMPAIGANVINFRLPTISGCLLKQRTFWMIACRRGKVHLWPLV